MRRLVVVLIVLLLGGCKIAGAIANMLGDVVGQTDDVACDRRTGKEPAPFCQEVIDTVAVSQVKDDCIEKFAANGTEGRCPRDRIIAGCKLHKDNDDGSEVFDWYYDVSDAGPDAGFRDEPKTKDDVKALCEDRERYNEGATYLDGP
ncbi:MAG: hypothetical protein KIT84_03595 [Labilithrix sp.]|nr:hypothetical protein [Labilithrix sp.]MCW5810067.1 hypothetical protein [Labilithrix sp.]